MIPNWKHFAGSLGSDFGAEGVSFLFEDRYLWKVVLPTRLGEE